MSSKQKHTFYSVNPIQPNMPTFIERPGRKFIEYGDDNLYPQFVASLFYKSAINRTCIQSKLDAVIGQGLRTLKADQQYVLNRANPLESWNDVFEKVALDYITFGGMAINVIWNQEGTNIAEIYHVDFTKVRSGYHNPETDKVEEYYYSSNWANIAEIYLSQSLIMHSILQKLMSTQVKFFTGLIMSQGIFGTHFLLMQDL